MALGALVEVAPVIAAVRAIVGRAPPPSADDAAAVPDDAAAADGDCSAPPAARTAAPRFTIVDLCCGKGFLSMFLSEVIVTQAFCSRLHSLGFCSFGTIPPRGQRERDRPETVSARSPA